jgi:hypothetical protein
LLIDSGDPAIIDIDGTTYIDIDWFFKESWANGIIFIEWIDKSPDPKKNCINCDFQMLMNVLKIISTGFYNFRIGLTKDIDVKFDPIPGAGEKIALKCAIPFITKYREIREDHGLFKDQDRERKDLINLALYLGDISKNS